MLSSKVIGVLAIFACLCFLALIGIQASEMSFYSQPPSIWPLK